jgi:hypothetical protein
MRARRVARQRFTRAHRVARQRFTRAHRVARSALRGLKSCPMDF